MSSGFIRGHWGHWGSPWVPLDLSEVAQFNAVRVGVGSVHPGLLDSLGCTLVAVGFIKGRRVHWSTPWRPSGSSGVAGFTGVRPGGRLVHPLSFGCAVVIVWFIRG